MSGTRGSGIYLEYRAGGGRARYYAAHLQPAGAHWLVVRHWGFVGCPGWHLARAFENEGDAARELERLRRRREREGYDVAAAGEEGAASQLALVWDGPRP